MSDAENLDIKKRARRRLVGAIALALLAAIVLPMMMEQEPHPTNVDIQITIPDRDVERGPSRPADVTNVPPMVPDSEEQVSSPAPTVPNTTEPQKSETSPVAPAKPEPRAEPSGKTTKPETEKADGVRSESVEAEAARARAILEGKELPRGDTFVLQIGAFSDAAKAERLSADLKKQGFAAYTERAGKVTRVRVGPVAGRAAADKAAAQLKALGFSTVITPR